MVNRADPAHTARSLSVVGLVLACVPVVTVWAPWGASSSSVSSDSSSVAVEPTSLIADEGWTVLVPFGVAVVLALLPVLVAEVRGVRTVRVVVAVLFAVGVLAAMASIGIFFVPALVAMVAAAATSPGPPVRARRSVA